MVGVYRCLDFLCNMRVGIDTSVRCFGGEDKRVLSIESQCCFHIVGCWGFDVVASFGGIGGSVGKLGIGWDMGDICCRGCFDIGCVVWFEGSFAMIVGLEMWNLCSMTGLGDFVADTDSMIVVFVDFLVVVGYQEVVWG